jgi:hypothetical protein
MLTRDFVPISSQKSRDRVFRSCMTLFTANANYECAF